MKKLLALTLSAILVLSLAACGKDDDSSKAAETTTAATTTEAPVESSEDEPEAPKFPELTADTNAIKFDEGQDITFAAPMAEKNFENDESNAKLSIDKLEGESMLKIEILDKKEDGTTKIPKIVFDIKKIIAAENIDKIAFIKADVFSKAVDKWKADDGTESLVPGYQGGKIAVDSTTQGWDDATGDFEASGYDAEWGYKETASHEILPIKKLVATDEKVWAVLMKWSTANKVDIYVDNLTFVDFDGNTIPTLIG